MSINRTDLTSQERTLCTFKAQAGNGFDFWRNHAGICALIFRFKCTNNEYLLLSVSEDLISPSSLYLFFSFEPFRLLLSLT